MELKIMDEIFVVGGAGAGFGRAISESLANSGAIVLAVSKTRDKLVSLAENYNSRIEYLVGDITDDGTQNEILEWIGKRKLSGIVFNAGGPPAGRVEEINMKLWDDAWLNIVRWKINLTYKLLPIFKMQKYGRLLYIESVSVKEPVANLVLSNAMRPAIVGFAKTLSQEVASLGININILAPGYHSTNAMERLFHKKAEMNNITMEEAEKEMVKDVPVGSMGDPMEMASLACWLLSPLSRYVTGQTITHDGGMVRSLFG